MTTMADVARIAGVSISTVSHVVNGTRTVSPTTAQSVREAIVRLGYHPNTVARALATSRTATVGLGVPVTANPTFTVLIEVIESELTAAGYSVMLHDTRDDLRAQTRIVRQLLDLRADGIILVPAPTLAPADAAGPPGSGLGADSALAAAADTGTPLVLIDRFADVACDAVASDSIQPVRRLTEHLADLGHQRIAVVLGLAGIGTTDERLQGYLDAVAARGLASEAQLVIRGESDPAVTTAGVAAAFDRPDRPTALVTTNNVMTLGALRAFANLGLRIPDDVALVCYDDFEWADLFTPPLTTMAQDLAEMGRQAVDLLMRRMADPQTHYVQLRVPPIYRHRESCGCGRAVQPVAAHTTV